MDVRRRFVSACAFWYPVVLDLHRFLIAFARAAVNEDGCPGLLCIPPFGLRVVWLRGVGFRVSAWEFAWVPGPPGLWRRGCISWPCIEVRDADVGFWPFSVGLLVKLCSFLASLHWRSIVDDLGLGGVSLVLILYERWAGERLVLEMSIPKQRRSVRQISVSEH